MRQTAVPVSLQTVTDFSSLLARRRVHVRFLTVNQNSVFASMQLPIRRLQWIFWPKRKKKVGLHLVGDSGMTPTEQTESCLFSSYFTPNPVGTHGAQWVEFFTSVRLKNGCVDLKTSPEPQLTSGREVSFFFFILTIYLELHVCP